jgi:hypothetical protein
MKKTYDVVEGRRSGLNLIYIRLSRYDQPRTRADLLETLAEFDEECLEVATFFSHAFGIELLQSKYSGPQWVFTPGGARQMMFYEPLAIEKVTWAGIQGVLDQHGWEAW